MNRNVENKVDPNPPAVIPEPPAPLVQYISPQEMNGLMPTGITINIKLPIIMNTGDPLFAINTDGFIPCFNHPNNVWKLIMSNMFPVQSFERTLDLVEIDYQPVPNRIQSEYYSHRICDGAVGVVLRLVSSVGQVGHFTVSHATGIARRYYKRADKYQGLRFINNAISTYHQTLPGMAQFDISTNRSVRLTTVNNNPNNCCDLAQKLWLLSQDYEGAYLDSMLAFSNQFLEDWLVVGPISSIENTAGQSFKMVVFFDYSRVTFALKMYRIIPVIPYDRTLQIFHFSKAYNGKSINSVPKYEVSHWSPGGDSTEQLSDFVEELSNFFKN